MAVAMILPQEHLGPIGVEEALLLAAGYFLTPALSGRIVRYFTPPPDESEREPTPKGAIDSGAVIGKCENVLTLTLVLMDHLTALGLIFAAKSLVRKEDIRSNSRYYLGGTLVNLTWGVLMGFVIRILLAA